MSRSEIDSSPLYLDDKTSETTDKGRRRASDILRLAREILASEGYAALSMRGLAARLGVSLSTVQHYYPSKERLVEAMLQDALARYQAKLDEVMGEMEGATPRDRFAAALDLFLDDAEDAISNGMFYELWALANRHAFAAEILDTLQARARKTIARLIRELDGGLTPRQCALRATLIIAQFQGLMPYVGERRPRPAELKGLRAEAHRVMMALASRADLGA